MNAAPDYVNMVFFDPEQIAAAEKAYRPLLDSDSLTVPLFGDEYHVIGVGVELNRFGGIEKYSVELERKTV